MKLDVKPVITFFKQPFVFKGFSMNFAINWWRDNTIVKNTKYSTLCEQDFKDDTNLCADETNVVLLRLRRDNLTSPRVASFMFTKAFTLSLRLDEGETFAVDKIRLLEKDSKSPIAQLTRQGKTVNVNIVPHKRYLLEVYHSACAIKNQAVFVRFFGGDAKTMAISKDCPNADLGFVDLSGVNLSGVDLSYCNLSKANLSKSDLSGANLTGARLRYADLTFATIDGANFSHANFSHANLTSANIACANLDYANFFNANLSNANLSDANLRYAGARFASMAC